MKVHIARAKIPPLDSKHRASSEQRKHLWPHPHPVCRTLSMPSLKINSSKPGIIDRKSCCSCSSSCSSPTTPPYPCPHRHPQHHPHPHLHPCPYPYPRPPSYSYSNCLFCAGCASNYVMCLQSISPTSGQSTAERTKGRARKQVIGNAWQIH